MVIDRVKTFKLPAARTSIAEPLGASKWFIIVTLAHRITVTPITFFAAMGVLSTEVEPYGIAVIALIAYNIVLSFLALFTSAERVFGARLTFEIDILIAAEVNLLAAAILEPDQLALPYRDVFWMYLYGTVALWTAVRGWRTGAWVLCLYAYMLMGMAVINGIQAQLVVVSIVRFGWAALGWIVPVVVITLADNRAKLTRLAAEELGTANARVKALRRMHDTAMQTLSIVSRDAAMVLSGHGDRIKTITSMRTSVGDQIVELRGFIGQDDGRRRGLRDQLEQLRRDASRKDFLVQMETTNIIVQPQPAITEGVMGATREAVTNAMKHSGVRNISVSATSTPRDIIVWIEDKGKGFDPRTHRSGFGIDNSIQARISELGGTTEISSSSSGTLVQIHVPLNGARHRLWSRFRPQNYSAIRRGESTSEKELKKQALNWFVVVALVYRIVLTPIQTAAPIANLGLSESARYLWLVVPVFLFDASLLTLALRSHRMLYSKWLMIVDVTLVAALNIGVSYMLPHGTLLAPGNEIFWGYAMGLVVFWTGVRGARAGCWIVCVFPIIQLGMIFANQAELDGTGFAQVIARQYYITAAFFISWLIARLARSSFESIANSALKEGEATGRAWFLRDLHPTVVQTFETIASRVTEPENVKDDDLMRIRGLAMARLSWMKSELTDTKGSRGNDLMTKLKALQMEFIEQGLRVEVSAAELTKTPSPENSHVLVEAARHSLANILRHSGSTSAVLYATDQPPDVQIIVRDTGRGCDPQAVFDRKGAIYATRKNLLEVSGDLVVTSTPGQGLRVSIRCPQA
ncbi:hypothetical protein GCM10009853_032200 [Glycomyces scopariae]